MAEGGKGDLTSIKDGSDADFEHRCTPCAEDNIREEAAKYCPECQEYLCVTCTRHHGRLKATRSHKLLDTEDVKHCHVLVTKCLYHPDRDIEMYCSTHDMVYCTMCIATEHRACDGVDRIDDVQHNVQKAEIQSLLEETNTVHERTKAMVMNKQNNIGSLEKQRKAVQQRIIEVEKSIIQRISKLKSDLLEVLDSDHKKIKAELESEICRATSMIESIEKTKTALQDVTDASQRQQFVQMKLARRALEDANVLHKTNESSGTKAFCFTENTDLIKSVENVNGLGKVEIKNIERQEAALSVQYKMISKKEINAYIRGEQYNCHITGVCQLEDGTVLLTDFTNTKVKRLDMNYKIKDHCGLDDKPTGICCIDEYEVAVKMENYKVQFISAGGSLSKTRCISVAGGSYLGMTCCAGDLWISRYGGVHVYSTSGSLIKSIDIDITGKRIFKTAWPQHMAVVKDTVLVTDYADGAVCLNRNGTTIKELRDGRLSVTKGVCVSEDGTVFISGFNSNNILMFSSDGRCLGELVSEVDGIINPISLTFDRRKHCIYVTQEQSNTLNVLELK